MRVFAVTDLCAGCGACIRTCPEKAIRPAPRDYGSPLMVIEDRCTGCAGTSSPSGGWTARPSRSWATGASAAPRTSAENWRRELAPRTGAENWRRA